jgi:GMP synthase (glutamine-hydrolysing)
MPYCIAIRHVVFEDLGLLASLLVERGFSLRYLEAGIDEIDATTLGAPDLVVVLGGPIGAYEEDLYPFLHGELTAIRARMDAAKPTLGVCLGAQLMAKALGARVAPGPQKEIGWAPLALTEAGRASVLHAFETTPVLHWHGDNFELPVNAIRLASTSACPNQAFAYGKNLLGLQFHIEVDPARIEQWLIGHTVELAKVGIDPCELRQQAATLGRATAEKGKAALAAWLDGVGKR